MKSKLLDVLPNDLPYRMEPVIETWSTENGIIRLLISIESKVPRSTNLLLRNEPSKIQEIAKLTEQDLQNLLGKCYRRLIPECKRLKEALNQFVGISRSQEQVQDFRLPDSLTGI